MRHEQVLSSFLSADLGDAVGVADDPLRGGVTDNPLRGGATGID